LPQNGLAFLKSNNNNELAKLVENKTVINIKTLNGKMHIGNKSYYNNVPNLTIPSSSRARISAEHVATEDSEARCSLNTNRMIEDEELEMIAEFIAKCWKEIGENLGIDSDYLDYLERDNDPPIRNRNAPYRMLFYWTQMYDKGATLKKLRIALVEAEQFKTLQKLKKMNEGGS